MRIRLLTISLPAVLAILCLSLVGCDYARQMPVSDLIRADYPEGNPPDHVIGHDELKKIFTGISIGSPYDEMGDGETFRKNGEWLAAKGGRVSTSFTGSWRIDGSQVCVRTFKSRSEECRNVWKNAQKDHICLREPFFWRKNRYVDCFQFIAN
jgi:hypothetical protein